MIPSLALDLDSFGIVPVDRHEGSGLIEIIGRAAS